MSDTATHPFQFREGAEAAQEASKGAAFDKAEFFGIENGESAILRFLHDYVTLRKDDGSLLSPHLAHPGTQSTAWIVVDQHSYVPTKAAPAGYTGNWPRLFGATCRKDEAFQGAYPDCFICDHMKKSDGKPYANTGRTWALAVLREEVREDGKIVGYKDKVKEVAETDADGKPTGNTIKKKAIVIVNMGWKNFFSALEGYGKVYGTTLDRDYVVIRKGESTDTDYQIVALDPITMTDGSRFDMNNPEHYARYVNEIDIPAMIADRASDEFYARFFDTRVSNAIPAKEGEGASAEQQVKPENDVSPDKMQAIADRVKGYKAEGGEPAAESAPAAAEPEKTPEAEPAAAAVGSGPRNFDE